MALFHLLGKDVQKEIKYDYFCHVMPFAQAAACDADSIMSATTAFVQ